MAGPGRRHGPALDTPRAAGGDGPGPPPTDQTGLGAEGEQLDHVEAVADAPVGQHLDLVAHRLDHARQGPGRRGDGVDLAAAVVRHHQAVDAGVEVGPHVDVLGHCTGRMVTGRRRRPGSDFDAQAVFDACAEHGVAVEINSRPERLDPPKRLLRLAVEAGCEFTIDTDAHAPGQLEFLAYGCERAEALGLDPDRIVNTWPVERLLSWADKG